jgi:hypothetical protein
MYPFEKLGDELQHGGACPACLVYGFVLVIASAVAGVVLGIAFIVTQLAKSLRP